MISVWGLFDPTPRTSKISSRITSTFQEHMSTIQPTQRRAISTGTTLPGKLFAQGWDAFWLDSAEPEEYWPHVGDAHPSQQAAAIGNGAVHEYFSAVAHAWCAGSLEGDQPIEARLPSDPLGISGSAAHWRDRLVRRCLQHLLGSAPPGCRRLNFALSGYPYWTTDIGGYW